MKAALLLDTITDLTGGFDPVLRCVQVFPLSVGVVLQVVKSGVCLGFDGDCVTGICGCCCGYECDEHECTEQQCDEFLCCFHKCPFVNNGFLYDQPSAGIFAFWKDMCDFMASDTIVLSRLYTFFQYSVNSR